MAHIIVSAAARADLRDIWTYIAQDDATAADHLLDEINAVIRSLAQHPSLGRVRTELHEHLRSFAVGRYVIFYHATDDGINVYRVLHGARYFDLLL